MHQENKPHSQNLLVMPSAHGTLCRLGSALLPRINAFSRIALHDGRQFFSLDPEVLLAKSRRLTGLDDFGGDSFHEPFRILLRSFEADADLNLIGRICVHSEIVRMLCNRLRIAEDRRRNPAIAEQPIRRPLFITGLPRSGSTFLHTLLAQDPRCRAPQIWEVMNPSPPPKRDSYDSDPRIARTERQLKWLDVLMPEFEKFHLIHARYPQECIAITDHSFMSYVFESMYQVYSYRAWHDRQDKRPAYAFHRQFLQQLQWRCPGTHWVLKAPSHLMALDALLQVYPDADIVQTHRDPLKVLPSCASLAQVLRAPFTNRFKREGIGLEVSLRWEGSTRLALELRRDNPALEKRFFDVRYPDLKRDPMEVVRGIYRHFERELTSEAEAAMQRFVAENPKDKHGIHRYTLEEFGLDRETEWNRFRFYTDQYGIAPER
ncbi:sulfotransferase [Geobacter sp. SVR]|uniref:sulfotransferase family protein n=1 Tax=Geobacter sp. SVR TaxID=2495594 RepID=UPI00143EFC0C|nr:sulfotransferase [Geobacter sp. SVR]BCS52917.1 putative sulfotransferase [Geobacter sp. SVR]GCF84301.1 sulfotransferase [Geobacter sp. SVR]